MRSPFQNIQVIKSFGLGGLYSRKLRQVQEDYRQVKLAYNKFSVAASLPSCPWWGTAVSVACFGWGVYRLWGNYITYGTMILFLQMAGSLSASFGALVKLVPSAISAATAAGRIMAVTELPREDRSQDKEAWELLEENRADGIRVETRDLVFRYQDGDVVLDGANFYADPGEIVALVGPSGRGKDYHAPLAFWALCGRRRGMWRSQGRERARASRRRPPPGRFLPMCPRETPCLQGLWRRTCG